MNTVVSIVLPMYRVAKDLPECLASLERQTYPHIELIFVDDCSPDNSVEIVERFRPRLEARGMRVLIVRHEVNRGVAAARSTALDHASGEWIFHYDADDRMEDDAIEALLLTGQALGVEVVGCDWTLCHGTKQRSMSQPQVTTGRAAFEAMCRGIMKWNLWLFLVRRSLIERSPTLRFLPGQNMGEDMMFMGKVFLRAERVAMLARPLYHYTKNDDGQLTGRYTEAHWQQVHANVTELEAYVAPLGAEELHRMLQQLKLTLKLPLLISPRQEDYDRWTKWFPEANDYIMDNEALPLRTRLLQRAASLGQWWIVRLYYEVVMKRLYSLLYK